MAPIAAIDIGSNSVRVTVTTLSPRGIPQVLEEARDVPRLIRDVEEYGKFRPETIEHLIAVLNDFRRLADAAGATIVAVATSAARDAANGAEFVERVKRELGFEVRVIAGEEEARLAFLGATYTLPVTDGIVLDIGGGSMEVVRFEDRQVVETWTLPLGAVRLTDRFLKSDPLETAELRALREYVADQIADAKIPRLARGAVLVGTGGTIRNLGKIDRARQHYPLSRLHGHEVVREDMRRVADIVQLRSLSERRGIGGLNEDRADTIVAGALVVDAMMTALRAPALTVSGQGLREGAALEAVSQSPLPLDGLRDAALQDALDQFVPARRTVAETRLAIVSSLVDAVGTSIEAAVLATLYAAAVVQDIGRCVDYYNRERHTEVLLVERGLDGWSHRELALICAVVRQAHSDRYVPTGYRPLINPRDHEEIRAAGCILAVAEALAMRRPDGDPGSLGWRREEDRLLISASDLNAITQAELHERFSRTFGIELHSDSE